MRNTGRTTRMIMSLPVGGAVIVVPSPEVAMVVNDLVLRLRGPEFDQLCNTVIVRRASDISQLAGVDRWISYDHTFMEMTDRAVIEETGRVARASNARFKIAA